MINRPFPLYTIQRCTAKGDRYGPSHYSEDAMRSLCGKNLDKPGAWWILTNEGNDTCTCKKCRKAFEEGHEKKES